MLARLRSTFEERSETEDFATRLLAWAGAYTILFVGAAHILICGEHFLVATYLGLAFVANFLGSVVVAASLFLGGRTWAWLLGDLVAGGALVGFVVSRTIGLPGAPEFVGQWFNIAGLLTSGFDALFIALSLLSLTPQGRAFVEMQQERIEQEQAAGQRQPLEQPLLGAPLRAPGLIEQEMSEIRSRMSPDMTDLRMHVEPQTVKEQVESGLRKRLRSSLDTLKPNGRDPRPLAVLLVLTVALLAVRRASGRDK
jgi:hypothetical protein